MSLDFRVCGGDMTWESLSLRGHRNLTSGIDVKENVCGMNTGAPSKYRTGRQEDTLEIKDNGHRRRKKISKVCLFELCKGAFYQAKGLLS